MLGKRGFVLEDEFGGSSEGSVRESKRQLTFESAVRHVIRSLSMQELASNLEPFVRRVVREEVERGIELYMHSSSYSRPTLNRFGGAGSRGWRLHFVNKLPSAIFTGNRIKAEDNGAIKIVLFDVSSGMIVKAGPLSSLKVEILVLNGDFGCDNGEDWDETDFDSNVICEREGKRPLITGELHVTLKDGVGEIGDITVTDNSSWTRSGKFRLGARGVRGTCHAERVREARSGAFVVKDHRGEAYKKHHPPSLNDEVWRLEKISKDGVFHNRLADGGIETVQDLLRLFARDPCLLRTLLGNGMSNKKWNAIIQHATSCTLDNKRYVYHNTGQRVGLVFDSIYKVVGATFDGCNFISVNDLSSYQMSLVEMVKRDAYRNHNNISEIVCPMIDTPATALQLPDVSSEGLSLDEQVSNFQVAYQDTNCQSWLAASFMHTSLLQTE
ncbi:hypothetical protein Syun_008017 [Stephania yunnanensis]|uniref:Uncharacterized protein n=1 Tax=Stephania yunnanensis TaxID=152371 RepID=A0AAP0KZM9_9MAGN